MALRKVQSSMFDLDVNRVVNSQSWISTEGQTVFTLSNGKYNVGKKQLEVYIQGVRQISGSHFIESSSTTFTIVEPLTAGTYVEAQWVEGIIPASSGHNSTHKLGGQDELPIESLKNYTELVKSKFDDIVWLKPSGKTDTTDSINAQNMIDTYNKLCLDKGTFTFVNQITLKEDTQVIGKGMDNTTINSTYSGFAFSYKSIASTTKQSPQFYDFTLNCNSGIQLNDPSKDIVDGTSANPQPYCMRPLFINIRINASVQYSGTGIEMIKCFDGHILHSNILNFNKGVHSVGSDICSMKDSRISTSNISLHIESSGTFGSQFLIEHNDLLSATECFVKSSDRFVHIKNNYCENQSGNLQTCFDITGGFEARIKDNRIEIANNNFYTVTFRQVMQLIEVEGNTSQSGINVGKGVRFTVPYTYYGYTYYYYRAIISHKLNTIEKGFPFNYNNVKPDPYAEIFSPSRNGLATDGYGKNVVVYDDGFVLPTVSPYTQTIRFNQGIDRINRDLSVMNVTTWIASTAYSVGQIVIPTNGNGHLYICTVAGTSGAAMPTFPTDLGSTITDGTVTWQEMGKTLSGTFNVKVIARADNANQTLTCRAQNGSTTIGDTATVSITNTTYKTYTIFSGITASDLTIALNNNNDTGNVGNIYIKAILIEYADLQGSISWNPSSLADGAGETSSAITVTGANFGDFVIVSPPYDTQGMMVYGYVSAANTVKIRIQNETGSTIYLGTGTWKVRVLK